jgi:hypothetical protein
MEGRAYKDLKFIKTIKFLTPIPIDIGTPEGDFNAEQF